MGLRYLRGPTATSAGVADFTASYIRCVRDFSLFTFYFLRRILGWTYVDEVIQSGAGSTWAWETAHTASGSDGVLTGSDYTFTSGSASFTGADIGRFLVIVDPTNESNCGIYEILTQPSGTQLTIDFYTTAGTFPTAVSSLEYYIIDGDFADPRQGDYFVLETGHATSPATIKFTHVSDATFGWNAGLSIEVAPESGAWDAVGHAWNTDIAKISELAKITRGYTNDAHGRMFAIGNTNGSFFHIWNHHNAATGNKQGAGLAVVTALETTPTPDVKDLVCLFGISPATADNAFWNRDGDSNQGYRMSYTRWWSEKKATTLLSQWLGWYDLAGTSDVFRQNIGVNCRTSSRDGLPIWITNDLDVAPNFVWAPWGEIPISHMFLGTTNILGEHIAFDSNNYLHIRDGVCIPWPGIPFA